MSAPAPGRTPGSRYYLASVSTPKNRDAYLNSALVGGREPVTITVIDYDDDWPVRFAHLRALAEAALGSTALAVEHIGSTSVPGLAAKPVVDMLLTVAGVDDENAYVPRRRHRRRRSDPQHPHDHPEDRLDIAL